LFLNLAPTRPQIQGNPKDIEVQIQGPIILDVGSSIKSVEGASLTLTCTAKGLPKPKIQWKFGEIVVAGELLKLPKLNPGDSKKYTCEASNLVGVHRKTTTLTVQGMNNNDNDNDDDDGDDYDGDDDEDDDGGGDDADVDEDDEDAYEIIT